MAILRVIGFKKQLRVETPQRIATIFLTLQGSPAQRRIDFNEIGDFHCVSHLLESDVIFYDTANRVFISEIEMKKPDFSPNA